MQSYTDSEVYMKMICTVRLIVITSLASVLLFTAPVAGADGGNPDGLQPIEVTGITPANAIEGDLQPGLTSWYYLEFFERDLQNLPKSDRSVYPSFPGKPILQLNHQFGDQNIFDSGTNRGVGIRMKGYINFLEAGHYEMQALSNDGIILHISDKLTINDPEQHSDRLSNVAYVSINSPGWYQVTIEYFQRKGTAALKLMWKTPGSREFVPLPPSAYAHLP
jgi:hypothetical protein